MTAFDFVKNPVIRWATLRGNIAATVFSIAVFHAHEFNHHQPSSPFYPPFFFDFNFSLCWLVTTVVVVVFIVNTPVRFVNQLKLNCGGGGVVNHNIPVRFVNQLEVNGVSCSHPVHVAVCDYPV